MADDKPEDDGKCLACDVAFWSLVGVGALIVGVIAFDTFSGGAASAWIERTFRKIPTLASVSPIRDDSDDAAG